MFKYLICLSCFCSSNIDLVGLVNLLRSNLTITEGYQVLLLEHTYLKDLVSAKLMILRETIIVFTFSVLHLMWYVCPAIVFKWVMLNIGMDIIKCLPMWQEIEKYKLGSPQSFHYLNQSKCFKLDGVDEAQEYLSTRRAMDIVGISEQEQVCFFSLF